MTIALPDSGDGSRRRLRQDAAKHNRRRKVVVRVLASVAVLALVAFGVSYLVSDVDADQPTSPVEGAAEGPGPEAGRVGLVVVHDAAMSSATLLVADADGEGGSVVHLPPSTLVEAPPLGLVTLRQAQEQGGLTLVQLAVENLIGRPVDTAADLDANGITAAATPSSPISVRLPDAVLGLAAGSASVQADQVAPLLSAPATTELAQLIRHQALWEGWLATIHGSSAKAPAEAAMGAPLSKLVAAVAAGEFEHRALPVESVGAAGESLYRVRDAEVDGLLSDLLPDVPAFTARPTAEVLNGAGAPGLALQVAPKLVKAGARVTKTGNADRFGVADTQVVYFDPKHADAAAKVVASLGVGQALPGQGAHVADLTVVVGSDFTRAAPG
jgi:LytR cell envelope-related transcriptional attenuator